jgi:uncharacterized protein YeaO (DUF488 family)
MQPQGRKPGRLLPWYGGNVDEIVRGGLMAKIIAKVQVRRAYDPPADDDGYRVLVDRLWPRGLSKDRAHIDEWCKALAPSTELRKWYQHDPDLWPQFAQRYRIELSEPAAAAEIARLQDLAAKGPVTVLTGSKRSDISDATVIAELLTSTSSD